MTEREVDGFKLSAQFGLVGERWHATICIQKANGSGSAYLRGMGVFFERESAETHAEKCLGEVIGVTENLVLLFPGDIR